MNIELASVPDFLQTGELYKILKDQDEPTVVIDPKFYIIEQTNLTIETFTGIMETIRYWGVEELPDFVYHFLLSNAPLLKQHPPYLNAITNTIYQNELEHVQIPPIIEECIANRFNGIVKFILRNQSMFLLHEPNNLCKEHPDKLAKFASKYGNLEILRLLNEEGYEINCQTICNTVMHDQLDCFQYLAETHPVIIQNYAGNLLRCAIDYNRIEIVKIILTLLDTQSKIFTNICDSLIPYCVFQSAPDIFVLLYPYWKNLRHRNILAVAESIAKSRQFVFLKYMYENEKKWHRDTANIIASTGYMEGLTYVVENGASFDAVTLAISAYYGNIECIKYLREKGAEWSHLVTEAAAENDNIVCLEYLVKNGCPISRKSIEIIRLNGHDEFVNYLEEIYSTEI